MNEHGKVWTKIVKTYFPGRTGLSAKNRFVTVTISCSFYFSHAPALRFNSITRFNSDLSRTTRPRRKSSMDVGHYGLSRNKSDSISSSSSASPESPSMSLPFATPSAFSQLDSKQHPYRFESFSNWSSSSSVTSDDVPSFRSSPMTFDYMPENTTSPSTPSTDGSYQYDISMNHGLSAFNDPSQLVFSANSSPIPPASVYKNYSSHSSLSDAHSYSPYSQYSLAHGPSTDQFAFDALPLDAGSSLNGHWDTANKTASSAYKLPISNEFSVSDSTSSCKETLILILFF